MIYGKYRYEQSSNFDNRKIRIFQFSTKPNVLFILQIIVIFFLDILNWLYESTLL